MKILFLGPLKSSFTKIDIEILSKKHTLKLINSSTGSGIKGIWNLLKCTALSIVNLVKNDIAYFWFADYTSLLPIIFSKVLRKKTIVVAGGFDVGYQEHLNYGAITRPIRWFCVRNSFKYADYIIPVSNYASNALERLTGLNDPKKIKVIYNAVKTERFNLAEVENRDIFLTVSQAHSIIEFKLKGSDTFINTAKDNPDYNFLLVGLRGEALQEAQKMAKGIANITVIGGPLDLYSELIPLYQRAYAYLQLSIEESFGVAVVEAMRCGCIPIISPNAALPEISGNYALIIKNPEMLKYALKSSTEAGINSRIEISNFAKTYDIKHREEKLLNLIDNL